MNKPLDILYSPKLLRAFSLLHRVRLVMDPKGTPETLSQHDTKNDEPDPSATTNVNAERSDQASSIKHEQPKDLTHHIPATETAASIVGSIGGGEPLDIVTRTTSTAFETHYITGFPLFLVTTAVTVACFLVLLDSSIIATVSKEFYR